MRILKNHFIYAELKQNVVIAIFELFRPLTSISNICKQELRVSQSGFGRAVSGSLGTTETILYGLQHSFAFVLQGVLSRD